MGRNKSNIYRKTLHEQAHQRLMSMQAFGESKKLAKEQGTAEDRIYSYKTYNTYKQQINQFCKWMREQHPEATTLKAAERYAPEYLQRSVDSGKSAWTVHTQQAALTKLFQRRPDFEPPKRDRIDIKRSRDTVERDKHFSERNNKDLIDFCKATGLRRTGVESVRGRDLYTRDQIQAEMRRILAIPEENRSAKESTMLTICKDTECFTRPEQQYFVHVTEKGGRERLAPVIGENAEHVAERFRSREPDEKIFNHVNRHADIHSYRADYATLLYRLYARDPANIPFDKFRRNGVPYQSEVYVCRRDEAGRQLDKKAMEICSKALGHNRVEVVARNYLRGL